MSIATLRINISATGFLHSGIIKNDQRDLLLLNFFKMRMKVKGPVVVKEVRNFKPNPGVTRKPKKTISTHSSNF